LTDVGVGGKKERDRRIRSERLKRSFWRKDISWLSIGLGRDKKKKRREEKLEPIFRKVKCGEQDVSRTWERSLFEGRRGISRALFI